MVSIFQVVYLSARRVSDHPCLLSTLAVGSQQFSSSDAADTASATDQTKYVSRCNECRHLQDPGVSVMSQTLLHQGNL